MNVLCSWPKAEKILVVNGTPVVYFGRTNDNKPVYWSRTAEVKPATDMDTITFERHYDLIPTGESETFSGNGHYETVTILYVRINQYNVVRVRADLWYGVGTVIATEKDSVFVPDAGGGAQFSKLFRDDVWTADANSCTFSIWRDAAGFPLNSVKQSKVLPPEHKSEHRIGAQKELYHYETVRDGVLFDCIWADFMSANQSGRIVDFSVGVDESGIVVKAEPHLSGERRKVFSYLDVIDQEVVSGVTCEVKDYREED